MQHVLTASCDTLHRPAGRHSHTNDRCSKQTTTKNVLTQEEDAGGEKAVICKKRVGYRVLAKENTATDGRKRSEQFFLFSIFSISLVILVCGTRRTHRSRFRLSLPFAFVLRLFVSLQSEPNRFSAISTMIDGGECCSQHSVFVRLFKATVEFARSA